MMDIEVYCDESRQDYFYTDRYIPMGYVIIGGLWIEAHKRSLYKDKIRDLRQVHKVWGEFKWNRVSPSRREFYLDVVRLFFTQSMRFRCIVLPAEKLDVIHFHEGDHELMFYKFYYQLLHPWLKEFNTYRIFLDLKTNRLHNRIQTLKRVLRNAKPASEILDVQALPSNQLDLIQLTDLLLGAVGYKFHQGTSSSAKLAVIKEIEALLKHQIKPTLQGVQKFNIFEFSPARRW